MSLFKHHLVWGSLGSLSVDLREYIKLILEYTYDFVLIITVG
jgi:putative protein kinase ArgK-like GTPase of G3E family